MHILQVGAAKTGNFWLYRILQELSSLAGWEKRSFIQQHPIHELAKHWQLSNEDQAYLDSIFITPNGCFFKISSIFRMPIDDFDEYLSMSSIVRSHSRFCSQTTSVIAKFDKTVYLIRDPRDMIISFAKFAFTPYYKRNYPHSYENSEEFIEKKVEQKIWGWTQHLSGYLNHMDDLKIHVVFYERLKQDFTKEIMSLAEYLDLELTAEQINRIAETTSVEAMQSKNPHHVREGKTGGWKSTLSPRQKRRALLSAGPLLRLLNYPLSADEFDKNRLPGIPPDFSRTNFSNLVKYCQVRTMLSALMNGQVRPSLIASRMNL